MPPLIEAHQLGKRFGAVQALNEVDLIAERGQVLGVLGPNGAGKTTLMRMLATLLTPSTGSLRVVGLDVATEPGQVRRVIGLAGQYAAVEPIMTGRENLEMVGRLFGLSRRNARSAAYDVLDQFDLAAVADRQVGTYSGGLRRRLDLGASLIGHPQLLLLDEPTTGLDPRSRHHLWQLIAGLVRDGTEVVLTTQYLEEADRLAGRLLIFDHGRVVADGSPSELKASAGDQVVLVGLTEPGSLQTVRQVAGALNDGNVSVDEDTMVAWWAAADAAEQLPRVLAELGRLGVGLREITVREPSLNDVFLQLTGSDAPTAASTAVAGHRSGS